MRGYESVSTWNTLSFMKSNQVASEEDEIIRVRATLEELASVDVRVVRETRYFTELSEEEIATALGVTERTVRHASRGRTEMTASDSRLSGRE